MDSLEKQAGDLLRQYGLHLAVAESCTGGLISDRLTNIAGSSSYFIGSFVVYAYEAKVRLLGVSWQTLEAHGAVSQETVLEMARGVRRALGTDIGLAVSGVAGPGGGTPDKPVGTVWIGISTPDWDAARRYQLDRGERLQNKSAFADQALRLLVELLASQPVQPIPAD